MRSAATSLKGALGSPAGGRPAPMAREQSEPGTVVNSSSCKPATRRLSIQACAAPSENSARRRCGHGRASLIGTSTAGRIVCIPSTAGLRGAHLPPSNPTAPVHRAPGPTISIAKVATFAFGTGAASSQSRATGPSTGLRGTAVPRTARNPHIGAAVPQSRPAVPGESPRGPTRTRPCRLRHHGSSSAAVRGRR